MLVLVEDAAEGADGAEPNAYMWATAEESRDWIVGLWRRVLAHSDAVINAPPLDAIGHVWWWPPERSEVTLHRILVHVVAEAHRHPDIVRDLIDGSAEVLDGNDNMGPGDQTWGSYRSRLEHVVRAAGSA